MTQPSTNRALPEWIEHLPDAIEASQAGFYFEEGGCIGMALALLAALREDGLRPRLAVYEDAGHMVALLDEVMVDHQGSWPPRRGLRALTTFDDDAQAVRLTALGMAQSWGHTEDDVEADVVWALDVISCARHLANANAALPSFECAGAGGSPAANHQAPRTTEEPTRAVAPAPCRPGRGM